ncbi:MAG: group 1 glycosyl transferase [Daejeonella sp.]|nr:group 1 glycosyl transferase [Daejeonella sp.]
MKPNLFFIIPYLTKGGAQRVVSNLSNYFSTKDFAVTIFVINQCEIGYHLNDGIKVVFLNNRQDRENILHRVYFALSIFFKLFFNILTKSPKHLIAFTTSANMWTAILGNLLNVPYIVSERTVPDRTINAFHPFIGKIVCWLYKRATAIVVPSKGMVAELRKNKYLTNADNIHVIRNPVSVFRDPSGVSVHPRPFILAVGRLHYVKGFDMLIDSYNDLKNNELDLIILGDGVEREKLTKQISDLGLNDSIFLVGRKENVQDYYDQCELFVLSSRNEGYPNVLIEAMNAGCASIAVDCVTGPSEIIENEVNGILIENGNKVLLTQTMKSVLADPELKETISTNAKLIGAANSMEALAHEWERLIDNHA